MSLNLSILFSVFQTLSHIALIVHCYQQFKSTSNKYFLYSWIAFWCVFLFRDVFLVLTTFWSVLTVQLHMIVMFSTNFLIGITLIISSDFMIKRKSNKKWYYWFLLLIPFLVFSFGLFTNEFVHDSLSLLNFSSGLLNYLVFAIYASRYYRVSNGKMEWILVMLFLYAGLSLIDPRLSLLGMKYYVVIEFIVIPLEIILYFSGYDYLTNAVYYKNKKKKTKAAVNRVPIDPNKKEIDVQLSLTDPYALIYIMWQSKSGRIFIYLVLITLVLAFTYIINVFSFRELIQLFLSR